MISIAKKLIKANHLTKVKMNNLHYKNPKFFKKNPTQSTVAITELMFFYFPLKFRHGMRLLCLTATIAKVCAPCT